MKLRQSLCLSVCLSVCVVCKGSRLAINRSRLRLPVTTLQSSDPGQVVQTCPAPLKLQPYGAIEI